MSQLIGRGADQVPVCGMLGTLAFQDANNVSVGDLTVDSLNGLKLSNVSEGTSGATKSIQFSAGTFHALTLSANCTITFDWTGCPPAQYVLILTQDATGSRAVTWGTGTPGTTKWTGVAGQPTINAAASGATLVTLYYDGATCHGSCAKVNAS